MSFQFKIVDGQTMVKLDALWLVELDAVADHVQPTIEAAGPDELASANENLSAFREELVDFNLAKRMAGVPQGLGQTRIGYLQDSAQSVERLRIMELEARARRLAVDKSQQHVVDLMRAGHEEALAGWNELLAMIVRHAKRDGASA